MKTKDRGAALLLLATAVLAVNPAHAALVAFWDFEQASTDDSVGGHQGKVEGLLEFDLGPRGVGRAVRLNGSSFIVVPPAPPLDLVHQITVAAWFKADTLDREYQALVTKGDSAWMLQRYRQTKNLKFNGNVPAGPGPWLGALGHVDVSDGRWHHAVGVYDGQALSLYVDGVLDGSVKARGDLPRNNYPVCIGANAERSGRCFRGLIDQVALFNHALDANDVQRLYARGIASFLPKNARAEMDSKMQEAIKALSAREAVDFLDNRIRACEKERVIPGDTTPLPDRIVGSNLYALLARCKEKADFPREAVAQDYQRALQEPRLDSEYVGAAFSWLLANTSSEDGTRTIQDLVRVEVMSPGRVYQVIQYLAAAGRWSDFERFLNALFSQVSDPVSYAVVVEVALQDAVGRTDELVRYCQGKPWLTRYLFRVEEANALKLIAQGNFRAAAEVYDGIVTRCGPEDNWVYYAFKKCENLLGGGFCNEVIPEVDRLLREVKPRDQIFVPQFLMVKGRSHVNVGDVEQAMDAFLLVLLGYPESEQAPEANFLVGYCHMLLGQYEDAVRGFKLLIHDYPQSSYVAKATSCLNRIEALTRQE